MKRTLLFSLLCLPGLSAAADTLAHAPGPRPTAAQVLDGKIPGRPDPATVRPAFTLRTNDLAPSRLFRVPPPGEHPRLLFSRADLPAIRQRLDATATGRRLWQGWKERALSVESAPDAWLSRAYRALAQGDTAAFNTLWKDPENPRREGPPGSGPNPVAQLLLERAVVALLDDNAALGRETGTASANYAAWFRPRVEEATRQPGAENFWLAVRPVVGESATLAFLYDLTHPWLTPAQAESLRSLLALITRDRYGLGMDLPPHWRNWNFIGMGLHYPLFALVLEGEPGYDPRIVARGVEVLRDYYLFGNTTNGIGKEAIGYHTGGIANSSVFALAMANRGECLFALDRFRAMFDSWFLWAMQPFGRHWASNGDLGTFPPSPVVVRLMRGLFPDDPAVALVARQCNPNALTDRRMPEVPLVELLFPEELGADHRDGTPPAFPPGLPLSLYDAERGALFARSAWNSNALTLQFNARSDSTFPSHDHPDRGQFILTALGQVWSVPAMRETESKYHSVITVDGIGQGYFCPPATWTHVQESPAGATATVDLKYCYDWRWMKSCFVAEPDQFEREPWLQPFRESRDRLLARAPLSAWERDPSPGVRAYYEAWQAGDPRMWGVEDAWVLRSPNVPVKKAFRSIALVRGEQPFVLLADDIRRDDDEHLYEWRMILPMAVEAHDFNRADILLGPVTAEHRAAGRSESPYKDAGQPVAPKGTPRLLVRILNLATPRHPETTPQPAVETLEFIKHDDMHQFTGRSMGLGRILVLPSRSVDPRYRVMLFPHRVGDPLPETTWDGNVLTVRTPKETRRVRFQDAPDGSTRLDILP